MKKLLSAAFALMLLIPSTLAQDKPHVMFLSLSSVADVHIPTVVGMVDVLEAYGFINPEDRPENRVFELLDAPENSAIDFNRMRVDQADLVRAMVATALDSDPDVLVTITVPVTLAALVATADMDDPPTIIFGDVYNVYDAGIADTECQKPAHVTGIEVVTNYDNLLEVLQMQYPDIQTIGTIHNSGDASGIFGASQIAELAAELGIAVEETSVAAIADVALATDGLIAKGAEAILLPVDQELISSISIIAGTATESDIPIFQAGMYGHLSGATVSSGFYQFYDQGIMLGAMVAAALNGEDVSAIGIGQHPTDVTAVVINPSVAEAMNIELSEELQNRADAVVEAEEGMPNPVRYVTEASMAEAQRFFVGDPEVMSMREDRDSAFLASLACE
ncbi:MAG: ABC transporter substrate binding protein [Chloroflexi bacterium]|nr:ABC transporter substrate binding protein [Chloroflexota bacterium]MCY4247074.1 ABC transporter substrate binding protein [Chloroflexota bacterium]